MSVKLDELPKAINYLERAVAASPPSSVLLGDLGYAQFLNDDFESAKITLNKALELNPIDKRLLNNQGVVLGFLGELDQSLELFRRAGTEAQALANVGFVLSQTGDIEHSKEYFHRALDIDPELATAAKGLVDLHQSHAPRIGKGANSHHIRKTPDELNPWELPEVEWPSTNDRAE